MNFDNFSSEDFSRFIYLLLLLVVVAGGVIFRSSLKTYELLKQIAIWSLIGLLILLGYSYRHDLSEVKNRVIGEIIPSQAIKNKDNQLIINAAIDGHFYIDIEINTKLVRFMVDTGASDLVLNHKDAKRIGVDFKNLKFTKIYQTANGTTYGANIKLEKIIISGLLFRDVYAGVSSSDMGVSLLGISFLRKFKKYEFYQDRLILTY